MSSTNMTAYRCPDCECRPGEDHLPNCSCIQSITKEEIDTLMSWPALSSLARFDDAVSSITQIRGEIYGHPTDDFGTAAALMAHFDAVQPPALRHALRMICVKLARIKKTPDHLDSYVDIVGYARTAVMVMDREEQEKRDIKK